MTLPLILIALGLASGQTGQAALVAVAKPDPMQKRVCRSETTTGSFMRLVTCHSRAEWRLIDAAGTNAQGDTGLSTIRRMSPPPLGR